MTPATPNKAGIRPFKRVGWKKRIGCITPAVLEMIAFDFYRFAPDGVVLVGVTDETNSWAPEDIDQVLKSAVDSARYLGGRHVDFVVHAGAAHVASRGPGFDRVFLADIEAQAGVKATTSVRSAIDAMRHLAIDRVAVASPWPEKIARWVADYVESEGVAIAGLRYDDVDFKNLHMVEPEHLVEFAVKTAKAFPNAQALYMPGPQAPTVMCIEAIEAEIGRPVIASTAAYFWAAFHALGLTDRIDGHGILLRSLSESP